MGTVYRALHISLKRVVALKVLPPERINDPQLLARFHREMEAVGKLDHPNIVRATDAGEAGGRHFLVMEFIDGPDLSRLVHFCGALPVADACELVRQAALGLQCAHEHGLVHRDVKPSNLLLAPDGHVKLLDLGLARLQDEAPGEELTGTGQVIGTADYMAPEQASGGDDVDIRADVYALGCTLYKLLAGQPPFTGPDYSSRYKKLRAHIEADPPPICDLCGEVPEGLVAVLDRLLAKERADRYPTPAEVAAALEPFAAGSNLPVLLEIARAWQGPAATVPAPAPGSSVAQTETALHVARGIATGTATRTLPFARRRLLVVLASLLALSVAVVALALGAFWLLPFSGGSTQSTSSGKAAPPAGLLSREPTVVIWPEPPGNSNYRLDPELLTLTVNCHALGMLRLGTAAEPAFTLMVGIEQSGWHGGIGCFFGLHEIEEEGNRYLEYQRIELVRGLPLEPFQMCRTLARVEVAGKNHLPRRNETVASQEVPGLGVGEHAFELTVSKAGLERVRWAGKDLEDLVTPEVNARFGPEAYRGPFGTFNESSAGVFHNARFTPLAGDHK
jgi:hypothetical protein